MLRLICDILPVCVKTCSDFYSFYLRISCIYDRLSEVLEKQDGKPAYYFDNFKMAVANIIAGVVYGNRYVLFFSG